MKRYVVFDIDGTLNQTALYAVEAYRKALENRRIMAEDEKIISCIGLTPAAIAEELLGGGNEYDLESWQKDIKKYESELMKDRALAFDGIKETLQRLLDDGYGLAICSNAFPEHIEQVLETIGVRKYFAQIGSLHMGRDKAEVLEKLLDSIQCQAACMVGDRIFDIQAARANHIPVVGCGYGYAPEEVRSADIVVKQPADIYEAVCAVIG